MAFATLGSTRASARARAVSVAGILSIFATALAPAADAGAAHVATQSVAVGSAGDIQQVESTSLAASAVSSSGRCSIAKGHAPDGWRRIMSDSFTNDIPLGRWGKPGTRDEFPSGKWRARQAGARDTSGRGVYNSMKTTSQHNGLLDVWVHSEDGNRYVSAPIPLVGDRRAMRVRLCMRAETIPGYKVAFMLWPKEGPGNYHGEIDYPENKLSDSASPNAFMHYDPEPRTGRTQDAYTSGVRVQSWHVYTMKWRPSRHYVSFYVDGQLIGKSRKPEVPNGPMHYIMQIETWPTGELPPPASGHVIVDWFTIDVPG